MQRLLPKKLNSQRLVQDIVELGVFLQDLKRLVGKVLFKHSVFSHATTYLSKLEQDLSEERNARIKLESELQKIKSQLEILYKKANARI